MRDQVDILGGHPSDWRTVTLGEAATVVNGGTPKSKVAEYWDGEIQWLTPKDMGKMEVREISETPRTISSSGLAKSSARQVPPQSVILSTRAPIGHLAINSVPMAFNQGCRGIIPGSELDHVYLYYFLVANREKLDGLGSGTTFKELSATNLKSVELPLPPLEEQKRIVAVLDQAFAALDRAREHAEANLADAGEVFQRSAASLFERISREGVPTETVAEISERRKGSVRTGPFGSQLKHGEFVDEGIHVLGIDNAVHNEFRWGKPRHITEEKYAQLSRYRVFPGDVVITIMGTCGRCAIIPDDIPLAINTKHLCCITLDKSKCLPDYLHRYFLLSPKALTYLEAQTKGTVMDGLNMGIIRELPVDLPSLEQQKEVCVRIREMESNTTALMDSYNNNLRDIADLRQSLLQKAFSGQLT